MWGYKDAPAINGACSVYHSADSVAQVITGECTHESNVSEIYGSHIVLEGAVVQDFCCHWLATTWSTKPEDYG